MITLRLFLLLSGTLVQIIINADNEGITWSDANSECNLLGSNKSGIFSEISAMYQDQVPTDGKMYWIAAIKKTTIPFKFNKCISTIKGNTGSFNIQGTRRPVYDCFKNCSGNYFALSSSQCVCTVTSLGQSNVCNYELFEGTNMDFYSESKYLEYINDRGGSVQVKGTGDCAAVILLNGTDVGLMHEFLPCDEELPYLCQSRNIAILHTENKNWTEAVKSCRNDGNTLRSSFNGYYPLTVSQLSTIMAWTGISRRSINQWSNDIDSTTDPYDCLAVSKDSVNSTVQIHAKNCSDLLPALCERSDSTIVSSTQLTTSEGEFEVTNFSDVTTTFILQNTTVSYLYTSPVLSAEQETNPIGVHSGCNNSLVPAIVGVAAAGVIIILLIVFIVIYKRFQQKNSNKVSRHSSGAVYSEINKSRQKSSTGIDGAAEQDGTDDTYDHTVNRKSRQSVHSVQENMYDHTTSPQKEPAEDNFYDSTCRNPQKDTIINDNEYGSVNPATGNDVYSHTNQVFNSSDADVENYDSMNNL